MFSYTMYTKILFINQFVKRDLFTAISLETDIVCQHKNKDLVQFQYF
jgi:hypothetical protein